MNSFTILNLHSILFQHYLCRHFPTYKIGIVWEIPILFPNTFEQFPTKRGQILRYITSTSLMIWNGSYAHMLSNILHIVFLYLLSNSGMLHAYMLAHALITHANMHSQTRPLQTNMVELYVHGHWGYAVVRGPHLLPLNYNACKSMNPQVTVCDLTWTIVAWGTLDVASKFFIISRGGSRAFNKGGAKLKISARSAREIFGHAPFYETTPT